VVGRILFTYLDTLLSAVSCSRNAQCHRQTDRQTTLWWQ